MLPAIIMLYPCLQFTQNQKQTPELRLAPHGYFISSSSSKLEI